MLFFQPLTLLSLFALSVLGAPSASSASIARRSPASAGASLEHLALRSDELRTKAKAFGKRGAALGSSAAANSRLDRRADTLDAATVVPELEDTLGDLQSTVQQIVANIQDIVQKSKDAGPSVTTSNMDGECSSLEQALKTATAGVAKFVGEVRGDVNLLNLAQTVTSVVMDLTQLLGTVEAGLAQDPALAPLVSTLAGLLNGPLATLLAGLTGLLNGLLPLVQGLLFGLGLGGLLTSLQGTLQTLLGSLGF